ncbi:MAG: hypothetical protein JW993_01655 [Sedimentisphaerales bacterium]|nr:hypothetical protein [Sedimentisphaerales bacterium]
MRDREAYLVVGTLACLSIASLSLGQAEPNAADLVRAVRASEDWLYRIDSLQFKVEGTWTHPPESIVIRRAQLKRQDPNREPDPRYDASLRPLATDSLEFAIDFAGQRLRYVRNSATNAHFLDIWDGQQLVCYQRRPDGYEQYSLELTKETIDRIFGSLSWPRAQPHSFWWAPQDVERLMGVFGKPADFRMAGRRQYRGVGCYLLEYDPCDVPGKTFQWYVGQQDHLLYGRVEDYIEYWTLDYQEIAPNCWLPLTQGYTIRSYDPSNKKRYLSVQRDARVVDVRVDKELPEALFEMEWKEGIYVVDRRSGQTVVSKHLAIPPSLLGQTLPDTMSLGIDGLGERIAGKAILLCFLDLDQRPSRHCLAQLAADHEQVLAGGVAVVAADVSARDAESISRWKQERGIPLPLDKVEGNLGKVRQTWGIRSLPWLILADKDCVVRAEGFGLDELHARIEEMTDGEP